MNKTAVCILMNMSNKRQSIPKGQFKMDNPEKLATQGTQDEKTKYKDNLMCVRHHSTQSKHKLRK